MRKDSLRRDRTSNRPTSQLPSGLSAALPFSSRRTGPAFSPSETSAPEASSESPPLSARARSASSWFTKCCQSSAFEEGDFMRTPQGGIFALGTASHAYLEFDASPGRQGRELVAEISSLREPRTTMGGVNLVAGF